MLPKEHGSWSLALEPLVLGLIIAPSGAGSWFALAVVAAFFARRPLRSVFCEQNGKRRDLAARAFVGCAAIALVGIVAVAITASSLEWLAFLAPMAVAGAVFLSFDLRQAGRGCRGCGRDGLRFCAVSTRRTR